MVPLRDQYAAFNMLTVDIPMMEYVQDKATGDVIVVKEVIVRCRMPTILPLPQDSD